MKRRHAFRPESLGPLEARLALSQMGGVMQGAAIMNNSASFFTNMSRPSGVLTAPGTISTETAARVKASRWRPSILRRLRACAVCSLASSSYFLLPTEVRAEGARRRTPRRVNLKTPHPKGCGVFYCHGWHVSPKRRSSFGGRRELQADTSPKVPPHACMGMVLRNAGAVSGRATRSGVRTHARPRPARKGSHDHHHP